MPDAAARTSTSAPEDPAGARGAQVLVVGAGPTGLALALWLARSGVRVRVVDGEPGPSRESRAIVIHARTLELLDGLGVGPEVLRRAQGRTVDRVRVWRRGSLRADSPVGRAGGHLSPHPYFLILGQDQTEALLIEALDGCGVRVEWRTALVGLEQDGEGVTATVQRSVDDGEPASPTQVVRTAFLAGCDGVRSTVREALAVGFPGDSYPRDFFVADLDLDPQRLGRALHLRLGDDQFLLHFPLPGDGRYRVAGQLPPGEAEGDAGSVARVRALVEAHGVTSVRAVHWSSTYRVHARVADRFAVGRVFLLGDACHVHSPIGGQGMNTGIGDAANLGWKLAQALEDPSCGAPLLATYGDERRPFAVALVRTTDRAFAAVVASSWWARALRERLAPALLPLLLRPRAGRRVLFARVSQVRLRYRGSPLASGRAGRLRAGDRVPWLPGAGGAEPVPLVTTRWWVLAIGAAGGDDAAALHALAAWCADRGLPLHQAAAAGAARRARLAPGSVVLVRPDGYAGFVSRHADVQALEAYAERWLPTGARDLQRPADRARPQLVARGGRRRG